MYFLEEKRISNKRHTNIQKKKHSERHIAEGSSEIVVCVLMWRPWLNHGNRTVTMSHTLNAFFLLWCCRCYCDYLSFCWICVCVFFVALYPISTRQPRHFSNMTIPLDHLIFNCWIDAFHEKFNAVLMTCLPLACVSYYTSMYMYIWVNEIAQKNHSLAVRIALYLRRKRISCNKKNGNLLFLNRPADSDQEKTHSSVLRSVDAAAAVVAIFIEAMAIIFFSFRLSMKYAI